MSGGAADCVSLAIAFHQAPGRFSDLLHGRAELPEGIGRLLRLAGGAEPAAEGLNGQAFVPAAEIRQAARFFIERVLLAHEADHYRVLGVRPDASLDEIKEHHRLLMRLFHPDREGAAGDGWSEAFATRINLAYTALRQPRARAAYDAARRQAQKQQGMQQPRPSAPRRRPEEREGAGFRLPPAVARNLPQLVLGGFALLASLAVGVVYLTRPPAGAIGAGDDYGQGLPREAAAPSRHENAALERLREAVAEAPAQEAPAQEENKAAQESTRLEATRQEAPPRTADAPAAESTEAVAKKPAETPAPVVVVAAAPVVVERAPVQKTVVVRPPVERPAAAPLAVSAPAPARREASTPVPAPAAEAPRTHAALPMVGTPPEAASDTSRDELAALVGRLSASYERGDLEAFLALFDEEVRAEKGGKARIRSDYDTLFRSTASRQLLIYDVNWVREGDLFRGDGSFQARVLRKEEGAARIYSGSIRLEVHKRGNQPLIRGIFHKAG